MGGIVISDELVERARTQQREAEAALRAKRDAQARGDADGELARLAQALADLGRRASELRQVRALLPILFLSLPHALAIACLLAIAWGQWSTGQSGQAGCCCGLQTASAEAGMRQHMRRRLLRTELRCCGVPVKWHHRPQLSWLQCCPGARAAGGQRRGEHAAAHAPDGGPAEGG